MVIQVKHTENTQKAIGHNAIQKINTGYSYYEKRLGHQFKKVAVTYSIFQY